MPKKFWTDCKLPVRRTWRLKFQNWKPIEEKKNDTRFGDLKASLVFGETSQSTQHLQLIFLFKQILLKTKNPIFWEKSVEKVQFWWFFWLYAAVWGSVETDWGSKSTIARDRSVFYRMKYEFFRKNKKFICGHMFEILDFVPLLLTKSSLSFLL